VFHKNGLTNVFPAGAINNSPTAYAGHAPLSLRCFGASASGAIVLKYLCKSVTSV
jgi:hypothetical protein